MFDQQPLRTYGADGNVDIDLGFTPPRIPLFKRKNKSVTQKEVRSASQSHVRMFGTHSFGEIDASVQNKALSHQVEEMKNEMQADIDAFKHKNDEIKHQNDELKYQIDELQYIDDERDAKILRLEAEILRMKGILGQHMEAKERRQKEKEKCEMSVNTRKEVDDGDTFLMPGTILTSAANTTTSVKNRRSQRTRGDFCNKENQPASVRY